MYADMCRIVRGPSAWFCCKSIHQSQICTKNDFFAFSFQWPWPFYFKFAPGPVTRIRGHLYQIWSFQSAIRINRRHGRDRQTDGRTQCKFNVAGFFYYTGQQQTAPMCVSEWTTHQLLFRRGFWVVGSRAASFNRPLLTVDVSLCVVCRQLWC